MRRLASIFLLLTLSGLSFAQTAVLLPAPKLQFLNANGVPLAGGCVQSYASGTTTPQATFTDSTGGTSNANPVILDSAGRASIFLTQGIQYKFVVTSTGGSNCSTGVLQYTQDNVALGSTLTVGGSNTQVEYNSAGSLAGSSNFTWNNATQTLSIGALVTTSGGTLNGTFAGTPTTSAAWTHQGNDTHSGNETFKNTNNTVWADQYANVQAAINACQSISAQSLTSLGTTGCTVMATSNATNLALGTLDPGANTVPIRLMLGPFDYTADHIVLRANFQIMGTGTAYTTITSVGANAQNLIVFPQVNSIAVFGVLIQDIQFFGASGNTSQEGLSIDVSTLTGAQFSYSRIENIRFSSFKGSGVHLKGRPSDASSANQWLFFQGVAVFGPSGRVAPALKMEGYNSQISFETCEFDGNAPGDGQDGIYLTGAGTPGQPLTVFFHNVSAQSANTSIHVDGVEDVAFEGGHFENSNTVLNVTASVGANYNVVMRDSYIAGNAGATQIISDTDALSEIRFKDNVVFGAHTFTAGANAGRVVYCDNSGTANVLGCNIENGFKGDGLALKHKRVTGCTTGATSGNTCTTTVTWTTAFADANYTPSCTLLGPATLGHLAAIAADVIAAASVKVETVTDTNAAITGTINCIAVHD